MNSFSELKQALQRTKKISFNNELPNMKPILVDISGVVVSEGYNEQELPSRIKQLKTHFGSNPSFVASIVNLIELGKMEKQFLPPLISPETFNYFGSIISAIDYKKTQEQKKGRAR